MQTNTIILLYFIGVLLVGIYSFFNIKTPTDYYVAGKRAGLIPVSGSLLATILGGSAVLGTIELSQKIGWAALWFLFCASAGLFLLIPISKRVKRYGNFTLPELLGKFYGSDAEKIASVIIPIAWLGIVSAQIIAAAKILNGLDILNYQMAAVLSGAVFIFYTLFGGQHSILKTDAIQSVLIISGLLLLVIFTVLKEPHFQSQPFQMKLLFNEKFKPLDLIILILTYSVTFVVGPDIYSRLFCAKNEKTATRSILIVAILLLPVSMVLTYLGISSVQNENTGLLSFAEHLLPVWMYGLFIAALLSAVMSSADTTLLTSSIVLSELISGNLDKKSSMMQTRIWVVLLGTGSVVIALFITSIIQSLLFALAFFSGAFVVPTLAGLLHFKVQKTQVIIAIICGGIIALTGKITGIFVHEFAGNLIVILSFPVNAFFLFVPLSRFTNKYKLVD